MSRGKLYCPLKKRSLNFCSAHQNLLSYSSECSCLLYKMYICPAAPQVLWLPKQSAACKCSRPGCRAASSTVPQSR